MEFTYTPETEEIAEEAALDGLYILRTDHPASDLPAADIVQAYKNKPNAHAA